MRVATSLIAAAVAASSPSPRRLIINGSMVSAPESPGVSLQLRGFNFWPELDIPITSLDTVVTTLLPHTNLARLVMVHWQDAPSIVARGADCYAPHATANGYLKAACVMQFDETIGWSATNASMWTIIAMRTKGGEDHSPIWDNATLATEYIAMLGFLASRYANVSNIAGFEVLAEPRLTGPGSALRVHAFQLRACNAVWEFDAKAVCFIGATEFYNRYLLNATYIIPNKPVIYAANYLTPKKFTKFDLNTLLPTDFRYPASTIKCGDLVEKKEVAGACPGGDPSATITFDKDFLRILAQPIFDFKRDFNVPLWIDQWGIAGSVRGGNASTQAYMEDALSLWEEGDFLWSQWIWISPNTANCSGYSLVCTVDNSADSDGCGSMWYPQVNLLKPLSKYLGGDGGGSGAPLPNQPPPPSLPSGAPLCQCVNDARALCSSGEENGLGWNKNACTKCLWKHESEIIQECGCVWDTDKNEIVDGACNLV